MALNTAQKFFYRESDYSYDPKTETERQGREKCARRLARAEALASKCGYSYHWTIDADISSREFTNDGPEYQLWQVIMFDADGMVCGSLGGVDFGPDGTPWGAAYRRVVEAELASEVK